MVLTSSKLALPVHTGATKSTFDCIAVKSDKKTFIKEQGLPTLLPSLRSE